MGMFMKKEAVKSNTTNIDFTGMNAMALANPSELSYAELWQLRTEAEPVELAFMVRRALRRQPPNEAMAGFIAGLCVEKIESWPEGVDGKDYLIFAASRVVPSLEAAIGDPRILIGLAEDRTPTWVQEH